MAESRSLELSNLSPEDIAIARRVRGEREAQRFSFSEFAREVGITRSALSNYEYGLAAIPFDVAMKICSRLDLSPRWLATGHEPQRPFADLDSIGLPGLPVPNRKAFSDIYRAQLAEPFELWVQTHPPEELIQRQLEAGTAGVVRRASERGLHHLMRRWLADLQEQQQPGMKLAIIENLSVALAEMRRRLKGAADEDLGVDTIPKLDLDSGPMEIADQIKETRKRCNLSQSQAARQWEIPLRTLKNWEQGIAAPRGLAAKHLDSILTNARQSAQKASPE